MPDTGPQSELGMTWEQQYWNNRYQSGNTSGYGSYGEQLEKKLKLLEVIPPSAVQSVLDIGCGDFNFGKNVMFQLKLPMENYTGYDISKVIVERNRGFYPKCKFEVMDKFPSGEADLLMCMDVLLHIIEEKDAVEFVDNLLKLWTTGPFKYLCLTAYERNEELGGHVRVRKFPYEKFGIPLVREVVEEDGSLFMYVFSHD